MRIDEAPEVLDVDSRVLVDLSPAPMLMYDMDSFQIIHANQVAAELYGWPLDELRTLSVLDLRFAEEAELLRNMIDSYFALDPGDRPAAFATGRWRHRHRNGYEMFVEVAARPVAIQGRLVCLSMIFDVTARAEALRQLLELAEHTHASVAERLHDGPVQVLTAASLRVGLLRRGAEEAEEPRLAEVERLILHALKDLRREMDDHRAPLEMSCDLVGSLQSLIDRHAQHVRLLVAAVGVEPPPAVSSLLYRVVQSLLGDDVIDVGQHEAGHRQQLRLVVSLRSAAITIPIREGALVPEGVTAMVAAMNGWIEADADAKAETDVAAEAAVHGEPACVTIVVPFTADDSASRSESGGAQ